MKASAYKNSKSRSALPTRRVLIIASVIFVWMFAIVGRLVYLQVVQADWLRDRARQQQQDTVDTLPGRGIIFDRKGRELARSVDAETLYVEPQRIENPKALATLIAPIVNLDIAQLEAKITSAKELNRKSIMIQRKLDESQTAQIEKLGIVGTYFVQEPKRIYPNGSLAAHILGFVGLDNDGLAGIEQQFDNKIKGVGGKLFVEKDGSRHPTPYSSTQTPTTPGDSIVLTIDQLIQFRTQTALEEQVEKTQAKSGSAIVLDARTGEILALANAPSFDPNDAKSALPQNLRNQSLQNAYEPGSTFKVVAYSAAIDRKLVKPTDMIDCQMGSITVGGRLVHDHMKFGTLSIAEALAKSSNVAAIKLGVQLGNESMADYISSFGFGKRTGIELPGETVGIIHPLARWLPSSIGSIAMGQDVGVTPLQMAAAYQAIANGGVRIAPHIIKEIRSADGKVVYQPNPEQHRVVSEETAREVRGMLEGVTLNGTAKRARLEGYSAAGKTGTAQKIDQATKRYSATKFIGSFVGFAPVDNPAIVVIVVMDEPKGSYHGGDVAAPVFREIAEQILPEMDVAPDTELKTSPGLLAQNASPKQSEGARVERERESEDKQATLPQAFQSTSASGSSEAVITPSTKNGVVMPDLRGSSVRDAMRVCAQLGLKMEGRGEGRAIHQDPFPGAELIRGQTIRLDFGSDN